MAVKVWPEQVRSQSRLTGRSHDGAMMGLLAVLALGDVWWYDWGLIGVECECHMEQWRYQEAKG